MSAESTGASIPRPEFRTVPAANGAARVMTEMYPTLGNCWEAAPFAGPRTGTVNESQSLEGDKMETAAVTVVIPTHNRPVLMQRALESVLDQKYDGEIEVIIVFDACDPFDPPVVIPRGRSVRTVVNERTRGLAGARNTGIVLATHDFVAFLDDDDHWLPGKLDARCRTSTTRPAPPWSAVHGARRRRTHLRTARAGRAGPSSGPHPRSDGRLHSSTFVFRREDLLGPVGLVDEDLPGSYGEDYDLLLRTAKVAPIVVVNEPLVSVTWSGQSFYFGRWGAYAEGLTYLFERHTEFADDRRATGRIAGQIAFARAANGERAHARHWVRRSLRNDPFQVKAWLALGISLRLVSAPWVIRTVQRMGKGI